MNTIKFDKKGSLVFAHRGLSSFETENSNAAFIAAANRSYHGIETDIRRTADGKFVISHDPTYRRLTGENIPVEEVTLATLQKIRFFNKDGKKNRADLVPSSLEEYLAICKKYEKVPLLELKSDFTDEETERIIETIRDFELLEKTIFISFKYENLKKVKKVLPNHPVQYLFSEVTDELTARLIADKIDVDAEYVALSEEKVRKFHEAGLKVGCWTVDNKELGEKLASWGVDYITTNILE